MLTEPAVGKTFFGREEVLAILEKRAVAIKNGYRQNIALTGQMLSGKSSILYQFLYNLRDTSLIPVYIEVVKESFSSFADKFIATLLYNYAVSRGFAAAKNLAELLKSSESQIPHTVYAIGRVKAEIAKKNHNEAYRKLLNLTSVLKEETGASCVVILDEFHNLEFLKIKKAYVDFGKIIMIQKDTMYIVSSSQKNTIKKILSEKLALLYGNFEVVEVSGFDNKTALAFLAQKLKGLSISGDCLNYLIDFTEGNPFYLDAISKKLAEIANSRKLSVVEENIIADALTALLHNTSGTINQYFTNSIMSLMEKDIREGCLDILIALAHGFNKPGAVAKWFNKKSLAGSGKKLDALAEMDLVYKNGIFYEITDKVFKFWLREVYHQKKNLLVDDVVNRAGDFAKEVKNDFARYVSESRKDAAERIADLFSLFNGESIVAEHKKSRLPRFIKVELQRYGDSERLLAYQKPDKYWVCEIRHRPVEEADVSDIIKRWHGEKERIGKRICVALDGIDRNALLLAKEKNIWVWSLKGLNRTLRLYQKHSLISL